MGKTSRDPLISKRFAPVGNVEVYRLLRKLGLLGSYHMLIAHYVMSDADLWSEFYNSEDGVEYDVILDNGVIETGGSGDLETILQATQLLATSRSVRQVIVVLPDVVGEAGKTIRLSKDFHERFLDRLELEDPRLLERVSLMAVAQGRDDTAAYGTAITLAQLPRVRFVGIPKHLQSRVGTRYPLTWNLATTHRFQVHLLGCSNSLIDDIACASIDGVVGMDSAMPIWAAARGYRIRPYADMRWVGTRPEDFWEWGKDDYPMILFQENVLRDLRTNLARIRQWMRVGPAL